MFLRHIMLGENHNKNSMEGSFTPAEEKSHREQIYRFHSKSTVDSR